MACSDIYNHFLDGNKVNGSLEAAIASSSKSLKVLERSLRDT
jgi:hypothetical protein